MLDELYALHDAETDPLRQALMERLMELRRPPPVWRRQLADYQREIGGEIQCPRCYASEQRSIMKPKSPDTPTEGDLFRCRACELEVLLPQ
jgi:hypothetical protein